MNTELNIGRLNNKVIVITGGAGALGQCFVRGIAERGGIAIAADINLEAAKSLANEITQDGVGQVQAAHVDITSKDSIVSLIADLRQRYGRIDAAVNNAYPRNKNYGHKLEDVTYSDFCENVDMQLGGYFLVAQQFCLTFKEQGYGNVVNMSSIYGSMAPRFEVYDGTPMTMPVEYAAIKSAIEHLTRYFAQYFKGTGIRVNCLSPGGILAGQSADFLAAYNKHCASKGMLNVDDILGGLLYLLSDESRYITGQNLLIDDGFSL
jgi:NAD(P)-dependent dehydrogenase (short-subunit alcohol dehydrogenase family)